jgi:signal transduction histidine kinase
MHSYHERVTGLLRAAWNAPAAVPAPPRRVWRDWALVALVAVLTVLEATLRTDLPQPLVAALFVLAAVPTLLWRRTRPLLMLLLSSAALTSATLLLGDSVLYASAVGILLMYSLFRWADGRGLVVGTGFVLANLVVSALTGTPLGELVAQVAFAAGVVGLGLAFRFRARARLRELDGARLMEREMLARDLHDTVAHHVSAIAIRAQAGLALAEVKPDAAIDALRVIEAEASTTLAEMRSMVRVLRVGDAPGRASDLAPARTLADIREFATDELSPRVDVRVEGDTDSIPPTVAAAVYRMAQESVTNARRHARGAALIDVVVEADAAGVRLSVTDDGEAVPTAPPGYGITGMVERAALLGGTCQAGRAHGGGWVVTAVLPRVGWSA